jgi:hypothetical protein
MIKKTVNIAYFIIVRPVVVFPLEYRAIKLCVAHDKRHFTNHGNSIPFKYIEQVGGLISNRLSVHRNLLENSLNIPK